jgi:hypothetical protein
MATQQFESAKKLILHFTQKNCMSPESDIKGVMPGECTLAGQGNGGSTEKVPGSWASFIVSFFLHACVL